MFLILSSNCFKEEKKRLILNEIYKEYLKSSLTEKYTIGNLPPCVAPVKLKKMRFKVAIVY